MIAHDRFALRPVGNNGDDDMTYPDRTIFERGSWSAHIRRFSDNRVSAIRAFLGDARRTLEVQFGPWPHVPYGIRYDGKAHHFTLFSWWREPARERGLIFQDSEQRSFGFLLGPRGHLFGVEYDGPCHVVRALRWYREAKESEVS